MVQLGKDYDNESMGMEIAIATAKKDSFMSSMNPLKPILHPVQKILHDVLVAIRVAKSIVVWEENYYPFWIATGSFLASLLIFFIPWGWILRWTVRVVVWVVLGPWMKVVDWLYFVRTDKLTPDEQKELERQQLHEKYEQTLAERLLSQKRKEQAVKLKSMMVYLFGKVRMVGGSFFGHCVSVYIGSLIHLVFLIYHTRLVSTLPSVRSSCPSISRGAIFGLPFTSIDSRTLCQWRGSDNSGTNLWTSTHRRYDSSKVRHCRAIDIYF